MEIIFFWFENNPADNEFVYEQEVFFKGEDKSTMSKIEFDENEYEKDLETFNNANKTLSQEWVDNIRLMLTLTNKKWLFYLKCKSVYS